jgi:hypothetical protein
MIVNPFFYRNGLTDVEAALLLGLRKHGRRRSFTEILDDAGIYATSNERFEIALTLEVEGYIHLVTYHSPATVRAELTPEGESVADSIEDERRFSASVIRAKAFH